MNSNNQSVNPFATQQNIFGVPNSANVTLAISKNNNLFQRPSTATNNIFNNTNNTLNNTQNALRNPNTQSNQPINLFNNTTPTTNNNMTTTPTFANNSSANNIFANSNNTTSSQNPITTNQATNNLFANSNNNNALTDTNIKSNDKTKQIAKNIADKTISQLIENWKQRLMLMATDVDQEMNQIRQINIQKSDFLVLKDKFQMITANTLTQQANLQSTLEYIINKQGQLQTTLRNIELELENFRLEPNILSTFNDKLQVVESTVTNLHHSQHSHEILYLNQMLNTIQMLQTRVYQINSELLDRLIERIDQQLS